MDRQLKSTLLDRLRQLKRYYDEGHIPKLHQHEVNPGFQKSSRENYLYFTLPVSLNFQRSSPAMWASALKTYEDEETRFVFFPEVAVSRSFEELQVALVKHKLALQRNKHTEIWQKIATTLFEQYESNPRLIIKAGQNCVVRIKNLIQVTNKKSFPYLSGQKMANYWLYILNQFTDIKLRNLHKISIIPDTHVLQSSIVLGLSNDKSSPEQVALFWEDLLMDTEFTPIDFHPILWNWSRAKFSPEV
mgnify:CR=1 FL=1